MQDTLISIIIGLAGISIVIFIHELGHFIAARLFRVDAEVLSFGFGPRLLSFCSGRTEYRLSAIPFGGYCRMKGSEDIRRALDDDSESIASAEPGSIYSVHPLKRLMIYAAGPVASFAVAVIFLAISASIPVSRLSDPAVIAPISDYPELFGEQDAQPGIKHGDLLLAAEGTSFADWQDAVRYLQAHQGERLDITVQRDGDAISTELKPLMINGEYSFGITNLQEPVIGRSISGDFQPGDIIRKADGRDIASTLDIYSAGKADFTLEIERDGRMLQRKIEGGVLPFAWKSDLRTYRDQGNPLLYGISRSSGMLLSVFRALGALITLHPEDAVTAITGPVKAAESIGSITSLAFDDSAGSGIRAMLMLLAAVSVSIAAGNILPIPALDGGQMIISLAETIKGKPLRPRTSIIIWTAGIIMAIILMLLVYSLDIRAYFLS